MIENINFEGIIGLGAWSINSAVIVYVQPKMTVETIALSYKKFLKGINLTKLYYSLYYSIKDKKLDDIS